MVARVSTVAFEGVETRSVDVQVHIAGGAVAFTIVGLGDKAVAESRERVRSALVASGLALPRSASRSIICLYLLYIGLAQNKADFRLLFRAAWRNKADWAVLAGNSLGPLWVRFQMRKKPPLCP